MPGFWHAAIAIELAGCELIDARLGKRLANLLHQIDGNVGGTVPLACQDWANTKAAYRPTRVSGIARNTQRGVEDVEAPGTLMSA